MRIVLVCHPVAEDGQDDAECGIGGQRLDAGLDDKAGEEGSDLGNSGLGTDYAHLWRRNAVRQLDSVADLAYGSQLADNTLTGRSLTILCVRGLWGLVYTEVRSLVWRNLVCYSFLKHYRVELHLDLAFSLESTHEVSLTATEQQSSPKGHESNHC